ncbi:hypothetical protein [Lactiplantibacillus plantarum]|uniref:hypothetical protein n=1 Tax=Lactiplantibacillus plantarum TaxID=1590 RepID=UPI00138FC85A|nr:hypothetical protein [Lactiplantibacillus plantarum]
MVSNTKIESRANRGAFYIMLNHYPSETGIEPQKRWAEYKNKLKQEKILKKKISLLKKINTINLRLPLKQMNLSKKVKSI